MKSKSHNMWEFVSDFSNKPQELGISLEKINDLKNYLYTTIRNELVPGASVIVAYRGSIILKELVGYRQLFPNKEEISIDTIYDLASLTKVVATWPAILHLIHKGLLEFDRPLKEYFNLSDSYPVSNLNIRLILTHSAALPERTYLNQYGDIKDVIIDGVLKEILEGLPGTYVKYCNRGFIILGALIEKVTGESMDDYVKRNIWNRINMYDTSYKPSEENILRIAPTEYKDEMKACLRGVVHDENALHLGGIAGHAGVFSTLIDLTRFSSMIMANGKYNGNRILNSSLIEYSLMNHTKDLNLSRGLGWDIYQDKQQECTFFGHTGFTGTGVWLNMDLDMSVILLTNRVHPSRNNTNIKKIREEVLRKCWSLVN